MHVCEDSFPRKPQTITHGNEDANHALQQRRVCMEGKKQNGNQKAQEINRPNALRDWERSEWFRRWLELIRAKKPQEAGC
jgi:hypothetical protein